MQSDGDSGLVGLEWNEVLAARVHQLEGFLHTAQEEFFSLRERYQQLRADFQFNLTILDKQGRDLERYDVLTGTALTGKHNSSVAGETEKPTEESEKIKWDLQRRIQELEKETTIQRQLKLQSEATEVPCQAQLQATEALKALKEFCQQIHTQLQQEEQEIKEFASSQDCRYKQQQSVGLKREKLLEQMRVQVELEWQKRCEDMKAEHYLANEQLIQDLTQVRDEAKTELKKKEQELQNLTVLLRSVATERDQAVQGLTPKVNFMASEEIGHLREQNGILRAVITQMRKDMEAFSHLPPQPQAFSPQPVYQGPPAQMARRPPAQSTNMCSSRSPAGRSSLEKDVKTEQEIRVVHFTEQSTQLQEEKPCLHRQQQTSAGLSEYVQGAPSNCPPLQNRLKQAARCIAHLSREKQQLIEMNNRLHAQITIAGLKGHFPEMDSSTKKPEEQYEHLTSLEQLQYQLTTQELQYTLKQRAATLPEQLLPRTNSRGPPNPCSQVTDRPESSINKKSSSHVSQSQISLNVGQWPRSGLSSSPLSSEESFQSLNQLWQMMDHGLSPSIFSEDEDELRRKEVAESVDAADLKMMRGVSVPLHSRPTTEVQQRRNPSTTASNATKLRRHGAPNRITKIRNYNFKD